MNNLTETIRKYLCDNYNVVTKVAFYDENDENVFIVEMTTNAYRIFIDDNAIGFQCLSEHYFDKNGNNYGYDSAVDLIWYQLQYDENGVFDDIVTVVDNFDNYKQIINDTLNKYETMTLTETIIQ